MQQLPYNPNGLQFPISGLSQIPVVQIDPIFSSYANAVNDVALFLNQELQRTAQATPLRTFMYNQMAQNGFMNNSFAELIVSTFEVFVYYLTTQPNISQAENLRLAVVEVLNFTSVRNVRTYPALGMYADPSMVNQVLNKFFNLGNAINSLKAQMSQRMNSGGFASNGIQQQFNAYPVGGNDMNHGFNRFDNGLNANNSGLFTRDGGGGSNFTDTGYERSFGGTHETFNQQPAPVVTAEPVMASSATVTVEVANKSWKPTIDVPYRPAFRPSQQYLHVNKVGNNFSYVVREKGEEMDPQKHQIAPLFGAVGSIAEKNVNVAAAQKQLEEAVSDAKAAPSGEDCTLDTYSRVVITAENDMSVEVGHDCVWAFGQIEFMKRSRNVENGKPIRILQWASTAATPIILDDIGTVQNLQSLGESTESSYVIQMLRIMSSQSKDSVNNVVGMLDKRLANTVNRLIATNMSLPRISIDSFVDDWDILVNHVSDTYGTGVGAILLANESRIISQAISMLNPDLTKFVLKDVYGIESEDYPVGFFAENNSYTLLKFFSAELDINFVKGTSALLSKLDTRLFYQLAEQIFKEFGNKADRHFVSTLDGHVLEISKGWMAQDAYLVSLVK